MVGLMAFNALQVVDMFWVSRLGPEAVAAVALLIPIQTIFQSVNGLIGAGSVALISRAYGRGDLVETAEMIRQNLLLKWLVGTVSGVVGFVLLRWSLARLGGAPEVTAMSYAYGRVLMPFMGFALAKFTCFTAFRCAGKPRLAMFLMLGAVFVNAVLDPILILGWGAIPGFGVAGAAAASVIASLAALAAGVALLRAGVAGAPVHLFKRRIADAWTIRTLARIGLPRGAHNLLRALSNTVIIALVATYGTLAVAAFGVANRLLELTAHMAGGFGLGLSALTGQELGASRPGNARKLARMALVSVVGIMAVLVLVGVLGAGQLSALFFQDEEVAERAAFVIQVLLLAVLPTAASRVLDSAFQAGGYTLVPTVVQQGIVWGLQMPLIWLVVHHWQAPATWVWVLMVAGPLAVLGGHVWIYRRGAWERWPDEPRVLESWEDEER
jgi:putative MATE family efflux protein